MFLHLGGLFVSNIVVAMFIGCFIVDFFASLHALEFNVSGGGVAIGEGHGFGVGVLPDRGME